MFCEIIFQHRQFAENMAHFTHGMALMMFVLFAIILIRSKEKNRLYHFLLWEVFFWVFVELKDVVYLIDGMWEKGAVAFTTLCIDSLCVPFTFALLFKILSPNWLNFRRLAMISAPFIVLSLITIITSNTAVFKALIIVSICFGIIASIVVIVAAKNYDKYLKENYSNLEHISVRWVMWFIILLMLILLVWACVSWWTSWWGDVIFYLFVSVMWIFFFFKTQEQTFVEIPDLLMPFSFMTSKKADFVSPSVTKTENKNQKNLDLASKLNKQMNVNHLYLQRDLSVGTLAMALATNRTYLSEYLNSTLNTTFFDYVNAFRVEDACIMLLEQEEKPLEEIAELCGFGSLSTFRRAFQKNKNMSPSAWRESHKV